jgi:thioredoxin-related protein
VRFVRVNGNENSSTVRLARDRLKVKKTPSFYLFRNQEMLYSWTGANPETFESAILKFHSEGPGTEGDSPTEEGD